jgi:hypothetical protein
MILLNLRWCFHFGTSLVFRGLPEPICRKLQKIDTFFIQTIHSCTTDL